MKERINMRVKMFTDGAARGNPDGPGGYGVVLQFTDDLGTAQGGQRILVVLAPRLVVQPSHQRHEQQDDLDDDEDAHRRTPAEG